VLTDPVSPEQFWEFVGQYSIAGDELASWMAAAPEQLPSRSRVSLIET
jgi:hypothetical protein